MRTLPVICLSVCVFIFHPAPQKGHVGAPLPSVMIKLVDVEEMNYFAANNEGEVRSMCI